MRQVRVSVLRRFAITPSEPARMACISLSTRRNAVASLKGGTRWRTLSTSSSRVRATSNQYRVDLASPVTSASQRGEDGLNARYVPNLWGLITHLLKLAREPIAAQ